MVKPIGERNDEAPESFCFSVCSNLHVFNPKYPCFSVDATIKVEDDVEAPDDGEEDDDNDEGGDENGGED